MPTSRNDTRGGKSLAGPLFGIVALVITYWLLSGWHQLPAVLGATLNGVLWPS
jgi:hypothetical protein